MTEPRTHHRVVRNRKKNTIPLSKLRTSDVVKTVVDHPRRLEELLRMLEDKDRGVRGRAAATLAKLSESHPGRLLRVIARLKDALVDDSAYVRWHIAYTFGKVGFRFPAHSRGFINELGARLDDENRIVRVVADKAIIQVAIRKPGIVQELFQGLKKDVPPTIARLMRNSPSKTSE